MITVQFSKNMFKSYFITEISDSVCVRIVGFAPDQQLYVS